jgi:hypothetical protein
MTYGYLKPQKGSVTYTPRIFGFKVRSLVPNLQRFFCVLNSCHADPWVKSWLVANCYQSA